MLPKNRVGKIISDKAVEACKKSNIIIGHLMILFDRTDATIYTWLNTKNNRLLIPDSIEIIKQYSGLSYEEILVSKSELV